MDPLTSPEFWAAVADAIDVLDTAQRRQIAWDTPEARRLGKVRAVLAEALEAASRDHSDEQETYR